jgi:oxygen-independent coproporphyrinogen-3 oxidase
LCFLFPDGADEKTERVAWPKDLAGRLTCVMAGGKTSRQDLGMLSNPHFDACLLRRYDRPGPRYTSYPTAPQFSPDFDEQALRDAASLSNGDPIPRSLSIYVHVPFCLSPCFYCGCNRIITRDRSRAEAYLARLYREIDRAAAMFDRDREAIQVHFGGGTPNFFAVAAARSGRSVASPFPLLDSPRPRPFDRARPALDRP